MTCPVCDLADHALEKCRENAGLVPQQDVRRVVVSAYITGWVRGIFFKTDLQELCQDHQVLIVKMMEEAQAMLERS